MFHQLWQWLRKVFLPPHVTMTDAELRRQAREVWGEGLLRAGLITPRQFIDYVNDDSPTKPEDIDPEAARQIGLRMIGR